MDFFNYKGSELYVEDIRVEELVQEYGTPLYIYSLKTFKRHFNAFSGPLKDHKHLVCYAVKANSNINILKELAALGSGFDIVSRGELERVLRAGGDASKTVFSGVGKSRDEIIYALNKKIKCFNVESISELKRINEVAGELNVIAPVSIRVNPDVDAKTHPYIATGLKENKFGISFQKAPQVYEMANEMNNISVEGIDCHIGSQLTSLVPFLVALERLKELINNLKDKGISLKHLDLGGGLGVKYKDELPPHPSEYLGEVIKSLEDYPELELIFEPGRAIAANAGILVSRLEYIKENEGKHFAIIDAAMNDLMRPALYQAWQEVIKVNLDIKGETHQYDIVGPVCETGDYLAKDRELDLKEGELLAIRSCGAYGFTMSSNYNSRPRACEILVEDGNARVIRKRETFEDLYYLEDCD
ncbi:diaminopimelate decarboxylase [Halobacteriovorax sp. YZS-1-1]|uniref:diaminopimelate decarboxylase n=1 Tax=unclassified Halobacteriovorax TaxID=2639665 RepID=UPI00399A188E